MVPITSVEAEPKLFSDAQLLARYVRLNPIDWALGICQRKSSGQERLETVFSRERTILFDIDTIELPTAASRWGVSLPSHPETTFDDLRAGRWPKPTNDEMDTRRKAMELARGIREQLDIRPLTTSVIIRQLRQGETKEYE